MPKVPWIESRTLEVQHAVVFRNDVQIPAPARDTDEFGDHAVCMGNGMKHVAAHGEIEGAVGGFEFENALMLERKARREAGVAPASELQMRIDDVDSEHARPRKKFGKP